MQGKSIGNAKPLKESKIDLARSVLKKFPMETCKYIIVKIRLYQFKKLQNLEHVQTHSSFTYIYESNIEKFHVTQQSGHLLPSK